MKCKGCGMEVVSANGVCPYCGSPLSITSPTMSTKTQSTQPVRASADGVDVFDKSIGGVIEVYTEYGSGSGFLISKTGYALTNTHVVVDDKNRPCKRIIVSLNGNKLNAKVIEIGDDKGGAGNGVDLAVLKLEQLPAGAAPLQFDDSSKVRNGETVFAIGNSRGDGTCITSGIVSDRMRLFGSKYYVMTDCAINPGNSGGPLLNAKGKVIGVNTQVRIDENLKKELGLTIMTDGMKYSIPSNEAKRFVEKYLIST